MSAHNRRTSPFTDTTGLVAEFLDDVSERPVPRGAETRLAEIAKAVAEGKGTVEMALDIIVMFPRDKFAPVHRWQAPPGGFSPAKGRKTKTQSRKCRERGNLDDAGAKMLAPEVTAIEEKV